MCLIMLNGDTQINPINSKSGELNPPIVLEIYLLTEVKTQTGYATTDVMIRRKTVKIITSNS